MDKKYTRAEARKVLGVKNNYHLANALNASHQRIYNYDDDQVLSEALQWRIRAKINESRKKRITAAGVV